MVNVEVKEFKIKLNKKEYTFRLDFKALIKFDNRYKNHQEEAKNEKGEVELKTVGAIGMFNNFLANIDIYGCMMKILSCACVERDFTEEELASMLSFDLPTMKIMDEVTVALIDGVLGEKEEGAGNTEGKNE